LFQTYSKANIAPPKNVFCPTKSCNLATGLPQLEGMKGGCQGSGSRYRRNSE